MPVSKDIPEIAAQKASSTYSYQDRRKDYSVSTYFNSSESILNIVKRLIRNEIINSHINK